MAADHGALETVKRGGGSALVSMKRARLSRWLGWRDKFFAIGAFSGKVDFRFSAENATTQRI
jgi:hypothetical protein